MKAIAYTRFGGPDVLALVDRPAPTAGRDRVRVAVHAAALNPKDALIRKGRLRWMTRAPFPRIPGYDVAGELLDAAAGLPAGTPVFGMIQAHAGGAHAEIAALRPLELAAAPKTIGLVEAAALPLAGMTALQALRDELRLVAGQRVLINGASGGVGTLAVQIARALGAGEVVGVCSARNADAVVALGAHRVVDYQTQDPAAERDFDAVFDCYGTLPWAKARACLVRGGRFCTAIPRAGAAARGVLRRLGVHRAALVIVRSRRTDLEQLAAWVDAGQLTPVVQTVLPLADAAEGHRLIETRRTRGKIVFSVDGPGC